MKPVMAISEFKSAECGHCRRAYDEQGVVVAFCGVRRFYCLDCFLKLLKLLSCMPDVMDVLTAAAQIDGFLPVTTAQRKQLEARR